MLPAPSPIRFVYHALQRILTLDVTWLMTLEETSRTVGNATCDPAVSVRLMSAEDVRYYGRRDAYEMPLELADRIDTGLDHCVGAFVADELASYAW